MRRICGSKLRLIQYKIKSGQMKWVYDLSFIFGDNFFTQTRGGNYAEILGIYMETKTGT